VDSPDLIWLEKDLLILDLGRLGFASEGLAIR
jgi:hypothetical protein